RQAPAPALLRFTAQGRFRCCVRRSARGRVHAAGHGRAGHLGSLRMTSTDTQQLSRSLGERLLGRGWMLSCAESCTGGLLAAAITDIPGSSQWFDRGLVTYSNAAKRELLGVHAETLERFGAVS